MPPSSISKLVPLSEHENFSGAKDKDAEDSKNEHADNAKQECQVGNKEEYELRQKSKLMQHKKYSLTNSIVETAPLVETGMVIC